jgi:hypothetical protein
MNSILESKRLISLITIINKKSVEEASGVCKDRVKWRAICRGGKK